MSGLLTNPMISKTRPTFTMLVGLAGVGKSTYAETPGVLGRAVHLSSDAIRKELYGDESCQADHSRVFGIMQDRTLEALKHGYDVIYDATNITRKSRKSILDKLPAYVNKKCVIVWASVEDCIERDANRDRTVGKDVIMSMVKRFEAPFYDEGFDSIIVYYSGTHPGVAYFDECMKALEIPHDNPHHSADVAEHCRLCGDSLLSQDLPSVVKQAGYLHDIGKPITKTFVNTKGETTEVAHYYGHQSAGAWISYGFVDCESVSLAWLISTHMAPFINQKYYNSLDPVYKNWIDALHMADVDAH